MYNIYIYIYRRLSGNYLDYNENKLRYRGYIYSGIVLLSNAN